MKHYITDIAIGLCFIALITAGVWDTGRLHEPDPVMQRAGW